MTEITMELKGHQAVLAKFMAVISNVDKEVALVNEEYAQMLLDQIRSNIRQQGIVETGAYLDSWAIEKTDKGFKVYTDREDAMRHEYGFVGSDSLGRTYATPPRPHQRPAQEVVDPLWREAISKVVPRLWFR